jgi:hypothetical protein
VRRWGLVAACCVLPGVASAQSNNGALDLLLPIGARATSMGGAFMADQGSEAIWWNPAGIARVARPDVAIDHFENFLVSANALSVLFPVRGVGVFGVAGRLFDYGQSDVTGGSNDVLGTASTQSVVLGTSFATTFGARVNAGVTFRLFQFRNICSGACPELGAAFTTSTVDAGVQFRPFPSRPLQLGVAITNLGPNLQVHDDPQSDPVPARLRIGAGYEPTFSGLGPDVSVRTSADLVTSPSLSNQELHLGAQLGYTTAQTTLFVRGGYVAQRSTGPESGSGPSLGLGLANGRVQLDFARVFETFSSGLGKPPTYVSIRIGL